MCAVTPEEGARRHFLAPFCFQIFRAELSRWWSRVAPQLCQLRLRGQRERALEPVMKPGGKLCNPGGVAEADLHRA